MTGLKRRHLLIGAARPAVQSLNLEVKSVELVVLVGPSGCGEAHVESGANRTPPEKDQTLRADVRAEEVHVFDPETRLRLG